MNEGIEFALNTEWVRQVVVGMFVPVFLYLIGRAVMITGRWLTTTTPPPPEIQRLLDILMADDENSMSSWTVKDRDLIERKTVDASSDLKVWRDGDIGVRGALLSRQDLRGHHRKVWGAARRLFYKVKSFRSQINEHNRQQDVANRLKML